MYAAEGIGSKYPVYEDLILCVYIYIGVIREIFTVLELMESCEHRSVLHVMSVQNSIEIREVLTVYELTVYTSGIALASVYVVIKVVIKLARMLEYRIVYLGIRYTDPGIYILIL